MIRGNLSDIKLYIESEENKEQPLITIAVTIYNIKEYLQRSIDSVRNQTYHNLEILLVDDGSNDGSEKICDEYEKIDSRIRVLHKKNGGPSEARNAAIEQAKGAYIAFVDGDDWIDEDMYENMYYSMKSSDAELAVCTYKTVSKKHISDPTNDTIIYFEKDEALESFIREEEDISIQNAAWNKLFKKELLRELRFPVGKLYEEIVFTTKLLHEANKVVYLNQGYYNYVVDRSGSIMNAGINARIFTDQIPLYCEKRNYLHSIDREDLVGIHNFFFYKRLLLHYLELQKNKPENYKEFSKQIVNIIKSENEYISAAYETDVSTRNEKMKMKIFRKSSKGYYYFNLINEKYIIPQKQIKYAANIPLIVVQLSGGLGNQMFQYALYMQLKASGKNVKIDDITEYKGRNARPIRLSVFGAKYPTPTETEMKCLTDSYLDIVSKIRRKLTGRKTAEYMEHSSQRFDEKVLEMDRAYLVGWWQSEKYFKNIKEKVIDAFTFRQMQLSEEMQRYKEAMENTNSVSVHIRRGDYLLVDEVYGGICTEEYYEKAMKKMEEEVPDCHFFVFTNDVPWVKEHMSGANVTVVEGNDEDNGYIDMYLMTCCKHYILANSSFSWWGCYLNTSRDKKVIAPKKWANGRECPDVYTEEMRRVVF